MSGGGEPGAQNIDVGVARVAALAPDAQKVLEASRWVHSPEQQARFEQARRTREVADKRAREAVDSSPKPLVTLAERLGVGKKMSEIPSRQVAEERDASIVHRSGDWTQAARENARADTISDAGEVTRHIVENGTLAGLDPAVLVDLRATMMELIPEIADVPLTDPALIEAFADANIRDPEVFKVILRRYKELQAREVPEEITLAQEAKAKSDRAFAEAEAKQRKLSEEQARLAERKVSLDPENDDPTSDNQRLIALRATRPDDRMGRVQGDITRAEKRLVEAKKRLESAPSDTEAEEAVRAAETEANRLIGEREGIQRDIDTIKTLTDERGRVDSAIPKNAEALRLAEEALQLARDRRNAIDTSFTEVRGDRIDFESDYANDYKNLIRDSIIEVNDRRTQEINARLIEEAEKSGNDLDRFMATRLSKRYTRTIPPGSLINERKGKLGFFRRVKTAEVVPDVEKAKRDVETHLLTDGGYGPVGLLRLELGKAYGEGNPRIAELMADPAFVKKWSVEVAVTALNAYQQNGGKLNEGQARFIASKGLIGPEILSTLLSRQEVQATEAEMKQKGELPPEGFKGALATEEGKKKFLALIFRIASGTMGPAAAAVVGSAAQTATGKGH